MIATPALIISVIYGILQQYYRRGKRMDINYNPLRQLIREQIQSDNNQQYNWNPIWHYTTANGFKGIIHSGGKLVFWFTRSDCLNDTSEGSYIDGLYQEIIRNMLHSKEISNEFYNIIKVCKTDPRRSFLYSVPPKNGCTQMTVLDCAECETYICCFSLASDLLDMWRYYSKNDGGYALKFAPMIFEKQTKFPTLQLDDSEFFNYIRGYTVIYDKSTQSYNISNFVGKCYEAYMKCTSDDKNNDRNVQALINKFLEEHQFKYKHPCFLSEQEFRFVYFRPKKRPEQMKQKLYEIKYRSRNGILIPYIEIPVESANEYLEQVMLSPMINDSFAIETAKDYLRTCGFKKCEVTSSALPVRA